MNIIQQKIQDLYNTLHDFSAQKKAEGYNQKEVINLSKEFVRINFPSQMKIIQEECAGIGHSVITIDNTDGTIIVAPNNATSIHYCEYCRKVIDPV